jgi:hypothetical protein
MGYSISLPKYIPSTSFAALCNDIFTCEDNYDFFSWKFSIKAREVSIVGISASYVEADYRLMKMCQMIISC